MNEKTHGITRKLYLDLTPPTEEDNRSAERRILDAIEAAMTKPMAEPDSGKHLKVQCQAAEPDTDKYTQIKMPLHILRTLHPLCQAADWKLTASLAWDGACWQVVALEEGDTSGLHYGLAVDLGSTTIVMQLVDCVNGGVVAQEGAYNRQIAFGEDILTRIFYSKDQPEHLEEIRRATVDTILELMEKLEARTGIPLILHSDIQGRQCISMVVAGNTTMTHFLLGMDAFCVFSTPYAVQADQPGFLEGTELGIPIPGYVFCYPGKANYLGGDIISGMVATDLYHRDSISLFFDVGTNGELVVGNHEFLLCGAGAAGPALEGGVVKTGMRAAEGAVQHVKLVEVCVNGEPSTEKNMDAAGEKREQSAVQDGTVQDVILVKRGSEEKQYRVVADIIGGGAPKGICGSGIIDLISELFLYGILDLRGKLVPEVSDAVVRRVSTEDAQDDGTACLADAARCSGDAEGQTGEYAFQYAPGLYFYQSDIREFIRTKAAAYTMMEYLLSETGMSLDDVEDFYMAGAFGSHVDVTSAVNIGMYPDVDPARIHAVGNTSLEGARKLLLDRSIADELPDILDLMTYVQFGAVDDFLEKMTAASALPHTDLERYPSVKARLDQYA